MDRDELINKILFVDSLISELVPYHVAATPGSYDDCSLADLQSLALYLDRLALYLGIDFGGKK